MARLAERGAAVAFEIQRGGVEEGDRDRAERKRQPMAACRIGPA
jgi:hypothetical protein